MSGKVHPLDWVNLYESHTPHEWVLQRIAQEVDPLGEERNDWRTAVATQSIIAANIGSAIDDDAYDKLFKRLRNYTATEQETEVGPSAIRQALGD